MRFPEFKGEWKEKNMEKIAPLQRGFDLPTQNIKKGEVPIIYSNGVLNLHNISKCTAPGLITGRSGTIGKFTYIESGNYWPHNTTLWVTDFCNNHPRFIYYLYQSININQFATGSGVPTLNRNDVHKKKCHIPSFREQEKISKFLSLLDQQIETQNKIIEQYKSLIKGITHYILKGKEADVKLKDCVACHSSSLTESEFERNNGQYPVYGATGIIAYSSQYNVNEDSILVIKDGAGVGRVQYVTGKYSVIGTLNYLTVKNDFSLLYIYYLLSCFNFDKYKVGSGIPHIYFKDYGNELIYCPPIEEQDKIAKLLFFIEEKLKTEQILLKTYIFQKEYLLQKLFI